MQAWLQSSFPQARVVTETPDTMEKVVPVIQVERIGGANSHTVDRPTISVDVYDSNRDAARKLAELVRDAVLYALPETTITVGAVQAVVSKSGTISGPSIRPYINTGLRRFGATYMIWLKRP